MIVFFAVFGPVAEPYTIVTKPAVVTVPTVPYGSPSARSGWPSPLKSYGLAPSAAATCGFAFFAVIACGTDDACAAPASPVAPIAVTALTAGAREMKRVPT